MTHKYTANSFRESGIYAKNEAVKKQNYTIMQKEPVMQAESDASMPQYLL